MCRSEKNHQWWGVGGGGVQGGSEIGYGGINGDGIKLYELNK